MKIKIPWMLGAIPLVGYLGVLLGFWISSESPAAYDLCRNFQEYQEMPTANMAKANRGAMIVTAIENRIAPPARDRILELAVISYICRPDDTPTAPAPMSSEVPQPDAEPGGEPN